MLIFDFDVEVLFFKGFINSLDDFLVKVNSLISKYEDSYIQFVDATSIGGLNHVFHGVYQAILAFNRGENFANDLSVEFALRISGQRQISKAFNLLGLHEGSMDICAIFINCPNEIPDYFCSFFNLSFDNFTPDITKIQDLYKISSIELQFFDVEDILIDRTTKLLVDY